MASGSQSKQRATSFSHWRPHDPELLFVSVEHCCLFCCANILLALEGERENWWLLLFCLFMLFYLQGFVGWVISEVGLCSSSQWRKKRTQINNKSLIKAGLQHKETLPPTEKNNLHWNQPLWVCLFYNDSPWGELDEALQARSHQPGHQVHVLFVRACIYESEWPRKEVYDAEGTFLYTDLKLCLLFKVKHGPRNPVLRFVALAGKRGCKQKRYACTSLHQSYFNAALSAWWRAVFNFVIWALWWLLSNAERWRETGSNLFQAVSSFIGSLPWSDFKGVKNSDVGRKEKRQLWQSGTFVILCWIFTLEALKRWTNNLVRCMHWTKNPHCCKQWLALS